MTTVAIVQARMGSTRLPGKVLKEINGRSMLARVLGRVQAAKRLDEVIVATTTDAHDDDVVAEARRSGVRTYRGSEADVLDRYHGAALFAKANEVVRITSDCPLVDPALIDRLIEVRRTEDADYATFARYPRGLDAEVFGMDGLEAIWKVAKAPYERAHVTPYLYQHPDLFKVVHVSSDRDCSGYRWTVDTEDDLRLVRALMDRVPNAAFAGWREFLTVCDADPELAAMNAHIRQKALEEG